MLDRLKFWRKEEPSNVAITIPLSEIGDDQTIWDAIERRSSPRIRNIEGDGKAEFLGEGSAEEFKAMQEADEGFTDKPFGL